MLKVFGGLLIAIGILIALVSGTCVVIFLPEIRGSDVGTVLLIGGIPFAVGLGLIAGGVAMVKRAA